MGFRQGAFARIWSINDEGKYSTANVSVSKKNKETNKYDVEFSDGYVRLVGSAHEAAKNLSLPTRENFDAKSDKGVAVKITSCDVTNNYDAKTQKLYTNCVIFGFEIPDGNYSGGDNSKESSTKSVDNSKKSSTSSKANTKGTPKQEETECEDDLPF